jgi:hypothetical protein
MPLVTHNWPNLCAAGLAKDHEFMALPPEYALDLLNAVFGANGQVETRNGFVAYSSAWSSGTPLQIFEYLAADGTSRIIASTSSDLFEVTSSAKTSRKGALTPSGGDWKFINFNGKVLGWQAGHTPIVKTGAGDFAAITASTGTLPDGNAACSAFGRVWAVDDDKQTIRYCALLDETKWAVADGGGVIDMRTVWTQGMDEVVAIEAFGSQLVVFGRRHIILWADGSGSQLGLTPINMYVTDTVDFVGALSRNAVCLVGELDVVFWSDSGIRSLRRTVQERASPHTDLCPKNRLYIAAGVSVATRNDIRMAYHAKGGFVLALAPLYDQILCLDVRQLVTGQVSEARLTEWGLDASALGTTRDQELLLGLTDKVGTYSGYRDFTVAFTMTINSGWIDVRGEERRKQALKLLRGFTNKSETTVTYRRDFDAATDYTVTVGSDFSSSGMQWRAPLAGEASFIQVSVLDTTIVQSAYALSGMSLYSKPLRLD